MNAVLGWWGSLVPTRAMRWLVYLAIVVAAFFGTYLKGRIDQRDTFEEKVNKAEANHYRAVAKQQVVIQKVYVKSRVKEREIDNDNKRLSDEVKSHQALPDSGCAALDAVRVHTINDAWGAAGDRQD